MSIDRKQNELLRRLDITSGKLVCLALVTAFLALGCGRALAQDASSGLLAPGNAVVTHFSGSTLPVLIPPGTDPVDQAYIFLDGASLRILDLQTMGSLPHGQVVNLPRPFVLTAAEIGQVFGVALDNALPPNIYAAATSVYGLPIVTPNRNANAPPERLKRGAPNARFMDGMWGASASGGGPGSIWKIDGKTGAVSLFANVALNGVPNSGPALGGIVFDPQSNNLYAADRETGMIHRFGMNGAELERYDHGTQGRSAQNLPAIPFDPTKRLNILSPQFNSENSATWNYAPLERRIFGLGIRAGRLYYAVAAGLHIWSVALNPDGSFGGDATIEFEIPPAAVPTEISKITFDEQGRMFLAERAAPIGAYDFGAMTQEGAGRVMRYAIVDSYKGAPRVWQAEPDEYAIGIPLDFRNTNGGVAIGYDYDSMGMLIRASCGGFLWSTGEPLLNSTDPDLARRLGGSGPLNIDGLQGNRIGMIRQLNAPPLQSYFVDYDGHAAAESDRGHLGDIAIWRVCGPVLGGAWPSWLNWSFARVGETLPSPSPPLTCPANQRQPGFKCCPQGSSPDATGQCKPWCPSGAMDAQSQQFCGLGFAPLTYDAGDLKKLRCLSGAQPDASKGYFGCAQYSPVLNAAVCQAGWTKQNIPNVGTVCAPTKEQLQCGPGQQISSIDNQCHHLCLGTAWPSQQCCAPGSVLSSTGRCCPPGSATDPRSGQCRPPSGNATAPPKSTTPSPTAPSPTAPSPATPGPATPGPATPSPATPSPTTPSLPSTSTSSCPPAQLGKDNTCCPSGQSPNNIAGGCCPAGNTANPAGLCRPSACAAPNKLVNDHCCSPSDLQAGGKCASSSGSSSTVPAYPQGQCKPGQSNCCESGYTLTAGACCLASQVTSTGMCCPAGQKPSGADKAQCIPQSADTPPPPGTDGGGGAPGTPYPICCAGGSIPAANGSCCKLDQLTRSGICCPAGAQISPDHTRCVSSTSKSGSDLLRQTPIPVPVPVPTNCPPGQHPARSDGAVTECLCDSTSQPPTLRLDMIGSVPSCPPSPQACAAGYLPTPGGGCCRRNFLTSTGQCCTDGTTVSADGTTCQSSRGETHQPSIPLPIPPSCGPNMYRDRNTGTCLPIQPTPAPLVECVAPNRWVNDRCCSRREIDAGLCGGSSMQKPDGCQPPNQVVNGRCCSRTDIAERVRGCVATQQPCPTGQDRNAAGVCVCADGSAPRVSIAAGVPACGPVQARCQSPSVMIGNRCCSRSDIAERVRGCVAPQNEQCGRGEYMVRGRCVSINQQTPTGCPPGQIMSSRGCVLAQQSPKQTPENTKCPPGEIPGGRVGGCIRLQPTPGGNPWGRRSFTPHNGAFQ